MDWRVQDVFITMTIIIIRSVRPAAVYTAVSYIIRSPNTARTYHITQAGVPIGYILEI